MNEPRQTRRKPRCKSLLFCSRQSAGMSIPHSVAGNHSSDSRAETDRGHRFRAAELRLGSVRPWQKRTQERLTRRQQRPVPGQKRPSNSAKHRFAQRPRWKRFQELAVAYLLTAYRCSLAARRDAAVAYCITVAPRESLLLFRVRANLPKTTLVIRCSAGSFRPDARD